MTTTTERCNGNIDYVEDVTRSARVEVDEEGNLVMVDGYDDLDVGDSSLYCDLCGLIMRFDYEAHGLSEFWEVR